MQLNNNFSFFVGTYTNGGSDGIYKYLLKADGSLKIIGLAAKSNNPSFLAMSWDTKYILAISEAPNDEKTGTIESYLISGDKLKRISQRITGGSSPCFVAINKNNYLLVANYNGGNVGLLKLDNNGNLSNLLDTQQHSGKGITSRQEGPHVHSAWFEPNNNRIITVDLGTNELWFSKINEKTQKLLPLEPQKLEMLPGAGPRHLSFHPNGKWVYVLNELDNTITKLQKNSYNNYNMVNSISCLPPYFTLPNTAADIHISSDGRFLYASNRGHDSIAIFQIIEKDGCLTLLGHQLTHGGGPRNFKLSPNENFLVVANQEAQNIVSFYRDHNTGLLKYASHIEALSPVCILF